MSEIADIYSEGDPFIEWNEANEASDDGEAVMAAERQAETATQSQAGDAEWTADDEAAALNEGWGIFDCDGSDNGPWQIQKLDDPGHLAEVIVATVGRLWDEDSQVWMHVWTVGSELHRKALAYVREMNPLEWKAIEDWSAGHGWPPSPNLG